MPLNLFLKTLFRIAHQWATSIDLEEYVDLLTKIYDRITHKRICRQDGTIDSVLPVIKVELNQRHPIEEEDDADNNKWELVEEDELPVEGFEYVERDGKRYKAEIIEEDDSEVFFTTRDPFNFTESVCYYASETPAGRISV